MIKPPVHAYTLRWLHSLWLELGHLHCLVCSRQKLQANTWTLPGHCLPFKDCNRVNKIYILMQLLYAGLDVAIHKSHGPAASLAIGCNYQGNLTCWTFCTWTFQGRYASCLIFSASRQGTCSKAFCHSMCWTSVTKQWQCTDWCNAAYLHTCSSWAKQEHRAFALWLAKVWLLVSKEGSWSSWWWACKNHPMLDSLIAESKWFEL